MKGIRDKSSLTNTSPFLTLAAAAFVSGANLRLFDSLLPKVADDFGVLPTTASIVVTAFTLSYGVFQIFYGPVGDRYGKLRIIAAATFFTAAASLGSAFASSLTALGWLRLASGAGAAAIVPLSLAWLGDNTSYENRQATLGQFIGFLLMGQVLGPAFGGLLAQIMSWRDVFFVLSAIFFIVAVVLFRVDRRIPALPAKSQRPDIVRNYLEVLRSPWVRTVVITVTLEGFLFFGAFAYVGVFLKKSFSLSYAGTGALMACYGIGAFIYTLLVKRLLVRFKENEFISYAGIILLFGFCSIPLIPFWPAAIPVILIIGFGFYLFHNTLQTKATEMAPSARGTGIAVFAFGLFIGQAAGVAVFGRLIRALDYTAAFPAAGILLFLLSRYFAKHVAEHKTL